MLALAYKFYACKMPRPNRTDIKIAVTNIEAINEPPLRQAEPPKSLIIALISTSKNWRVAIFTVPSRPGGVLMSKGLANRLLSR